MCNNMSDQFLALLPNLGTGEIVVICLVILLFFGAKRLPELSESLGKSLRRFKKATTEVEEDLKSALEEDKTKDRQDQESEST